MKTPTLEPRTRPPRAANEPRAEPCRGSVDGDRARHRAGVDRALVGIGAGRVELKRKGLAVAHVGRAPHPRIAAGVVAGP